MRQAGRSLPEYRAARGGTAMLDACLTPALASEITLQPVRRHGVDAAIFFSDIVIPLKLAGVDVEIVPGVGPVMGSPVRTADDVARLRALGPLTPEAFAPISEGVAPRSTPSAGPRSSGSPARPSRWPPTSSRAVRRATTSPRAPSCTPTPSRGPS